jgi:Patatin-like phospholipase
MEPTLGLALSGGGHRTAFFHIGVLAKLAELGLLRRIEVIVTVSGGSIGGGLFYLHLKDLLEDKSHTRERVPRSQPSGFPRLVPGVMASSYLGRFASLRTEGESMLLISEFELPEERDADAFTQFMQDEYIPAVHKGPTRVGQVEGLELLQGAPTETSHRFLWLIRWNGVEPGPHARLVDDTMLGKFEAFGASMKDPVSWREVTRWSESTS